MQKGSCIIERAFVIAAERIADDNNEFAIAHMVSRAQYGINAFRLPEQLMKLMASLEEDDDIQDVTSNFEVSDDVLRKLTAA